MALFASRRRAVGQGSENQGEAEVYDGVKESVTSGSDGGRSKGAGIIR
jgi:hypothetical protein